MIYAINMDTSFVHPDKIDEDVMDTSPVHTVEKDEDAMDTSPDPTDEKDEKDEDDMDTSPDYTDETDGGVMDVDPLMYSPANNDSKGRKAMEIDNTIYLGCCLINPWQDGLKFIGTFNERLPIKCPNPRCSGTTIIPLGFDDNTPWKDGECPSCRSSIEIKSVRLTSEMSDGLILNGGSFDMWQKLPSPPILVVVGYSTIETSEGISVSVNEIRYYAPYNYAVYPSPNSTSSRIKTLGTNAGVSPVYLQVFPNFEYLMKTSS